MVRSGPDLVRVKLLPSCNFSKGFSKGFGGQFRGVKRTNKDADKFRKLQNAKNEVN